jgi:hypothetical protein
VKAVTDKDFLRSFIPSVALGNTTVNFWTFPDTMDEGCMAEENEETDSKGYGRRRRRN